MKFCSDGICTELISYLNKVAVGMSMGAYLEYIVLALALVGASYLRRDRVVRVLVIAAVAAVLLLSVGPALKPYFDTMPFLPRANISRFILLAVIPLYG